MKKIKCIDNNGYNITVGNEYNLIQESQDFYFLVNDNQKTVKYGKQMFELLDDEVPQIAEPVILTEQQMIDSIVYDAGTITFKNKEGEEVVLENDDLEFDDTTISCGIEQVSELDTLIDNVNEICDNNLDDDYITLRKAIFRTKIQKDVIGDTSKAMRIMSTTSGKDENLLPVLDELAAWTSNSVNNPNSGNNIKMWVFYTN